MIDVAHVREHVLALPVLVVRAVLYELVPRRYLILEQVLVDVRDRAEIQEELVGVVSLYPDPLGAADSRVAGGPAERIQEPEGTVVVIIVSDELVAGCTLG